MLAAMVIHEISIAEINLEDERFRISEELEPAAVLQSLREIGQLNPVLLIEQEARKTILCGFRRVLALRRLGVRRVLARILSGESCDPVDAYLKALWDNLAHRQLDPLEKARFLSNLRSNFHVPDETLRTAYLPILGLKPSESVLSGYLLLHRVQPMLRKCFVEGRLTQASVEALAEMPEAVQTGFALLMDRMRLSASLQRKFLNLLEDLAVATGAEWAAPLRSPDILAISNDPRLSSFQRGEKVYEFLYRVRNPRLSQTMDQFLARKKKLGFPGSVRIAPHPFFEEPGVRVEFNAENFDRFRDLAAALYEAANNPEMKDLFVLW